MSFFIGIAIFLLILKATPAIVKRIEGGAMDRAGSQRVDELERRLAEVEDNLRTLGGATDSRLVDLEERQDINERVLQQVKDVRTLPRGQ
jgi:uncharacterized coiled-coil protein SlyX